MPYPNSHQSASGLELKQLGLIGYPLGHSFSKTYFEDKFKAGNIKGFSYSNFELQDIHLLPDLIESHPRLTGLNVTIPHKQSVISFIDHLDPVAAETGAVNTIRITPGPSGKVLAGYNTDIIGFAGSLPEWIIRERPPALVFGTGGASLAVVYALRRMHIPYRVVSRNPVGEGCRYDDLSVDIIRKNILLINCTPVGMHPNTEESLPLPYEGITENHFLYDLIYNPVTTAFLRKGQERGARIKNGLEMLQRQADEAWRIWTS